MVHEVEPNLLGDFLERSVPPVPEELVRTPPRHYVHVVEAGPGSRSVTATPG